MSLPAPRSPQSSAPQPTQPRAPQRPTQQPAPLPWERPTDTLPIAQRIASLVARRIVEKHYEAGTLLIEADLAAEAGASRTPAREAMVQLETWGLVRLMPKKGALVCALSTKDVVDLISLRTMLEVDAVTNLAHNGTDPTTLGTDLTQLGTHLTTTLEDQRAAATDANILAFAAADYRFHAQIIEAGGNQLVSEILTNLAPRIARLTYQVAIDNPHLIAKYLTEHEQLAQLALTANLDGFAQLARAHVFEANFPA